MRWLRLPKLGRDRVVDHYISCALQADAEHIGSLGQADGFSVRLEKPTRQRWVVTLSHAARPGRSYQRAMERKWRAIAATVKDGHYDGWGTEWGNDGPPGTTDP